MVTLVLVAMIAGVLWSSLSQSLVLGHRLQPRLTALPEQLVRGEAVRRTLAAIVPDNRRRSGFTGEPDRVRGITLQTATGQTFPIASEWRIQRRADNPEGRDWQLVLVQGQSEHLLLSWRGERGRFVFLDHDLAWQTRWRADRAAALGPQDILSNASRAETEEPLPAAIRFETRSQAGDLVITAALAARGGTPESRADFLARPDEP